MNELKSIIINNILQNTKGPKGFAIFLFGENNYDVFLPTNDIEKYYFFTYVNGKFYDLYFKEILIQEIQLSIYETVDLIEENFRKVLLYTGIYIQEHDRLSYSDYKTPKNTNAEKYIEIGYKAFQQENFQEAFNNYNHAVSLEPYNSNYYKSRATCFVKSKQFSNAIYDVCRGAIANPVSKQNIFTFVYEDLATICRIANDFKSAVKFYSLNYENTGHFWILQKRAKCYTELGELNLAIRDYEKLLQDERKIEILIDYAEALIKDNNKTKAEIILNEIINFSVNNKEEWIVNMMENKNRPVKDKAKKLLAEL